LCNCTERHTTDTTETVNTYFNSHLLTPNYWPISAGLF